jgi:hypothetical protein
LDKVFGKRKRLRRGEISHPLRDQIGLVTNLRVEPRFNFISEAIVVPKVPSSSLSLPVPAKRGRNALSEMRNFKQANGFARLCPAKTQTKGANSEQKPRFAIVWFVNLSI